MTRESRVAHGLAARSHRVASGLLVLADWPLHEPLKPRSGSNINGRDDAKSDGASSNPLPELLPSDRDDAGASWRLGGHSTGGETRFA